MNVARLLESDKHRFRLWLSKSMSLSFHICKVGILIVHVS